MRLQMTGGRLNDRLITYRGQPNRIRSNRGEVLPFPAELPGYGTGRQRWTNRARSDAVGENDQISR